jgi:hypothetical protein
MASALARRSNTKRSKFPPARRPSGAIRRAGGAIARKAASAAAGAVRRAKESQKTKGLVYGGIATVVGAGAEVKLANRLPAMPLGAPPQLVLGIAGLAAGFVTKGKISEALVLGSQGPFFAGLSSITKRLVSGGTLAGEFDGENYGQQGGVPTSVAGEFDDIAR